MWKIKNKEAVSPVIGVILMVAITVVLAAVLYVWVSGFMGGGGQTPTVSLGSGTVASGKQDVNWSIVGVSRADIKWSDVSATVSLNGTSVSATINVVIAGTSTELSAYTGTEYVKAGHTIHVKLASATGGGARVDVTLVYDSTGGMMGTTYAIVT